MKTPENNALTGVLISENPLESEKDCLRKESLSNWQSEIDGHSQAASSEQIETEVSDLLRAHAAALSRYAARFSRDRAIAQDGLQETFLRYFIARVRGDQMDNPRAWLFRVLRNYLLDCNRKSNSMPAADLKEAMQIADIRQDVESGYQQSETYRQAVSYLSPREQECMRLRLEGSDYDEIAQILQIRPGTVGALLARGLKKIRSAGLHY